MSKKLIKRIDAWMFDSNIDIEGAFNIIQDCRDELTKQAERVKALEDVIASVEESCRCNSVSSTEFIQSRHWANCADELAAVLKEVEDY